MFHKAFELTQYLMQWCIIMVIAINKITNISEV